MNFNTKVFAAAVAAFFVVAMMGNNGGGSRSAASMARPMTLPTPTPEPEKADRTVDNAYELCEVFDRTHLMSDRCDVSGWGQSVTVVGNMTPDTAQQVCTFLVGDLARRNRHFDSGWTLKIKSPYSGDNPIAYCDLPS